ncbi:MAG TPA: glutaredoxin 3 [Gammaproteobacteria bacterium]|nr:glutaredoxin 3 [Gammaproteobacteria bacterium]
MSEVIMYCTRFCPYCIRADQLLTRKGVPFRKIPVDNKPELWDEMQQRSGRDTVPQIFIGDRHVGGYDDLVELDMAGELDPLLQPILEAASR